MKKDKIFLIGPILLFILISFCFSGCSPNTITAKTVAENPIIEHSSLADTLSAGLADSDVEEIIKEPETVREIRLEAPRPKVEPEIQKIIKEKPKETIQVVLIVKNDEDIEKISKLIEESSGDVTGKYKVGDVISAEITAEKLEEISKDDAIEEIALEKEYFAFLNESIPQISIDTIAWASNYTGKGMKIAILDTGIDTTHEMFGSRILLSKSFNAEGINDLNGHGSHCAGIAAGNGRYKGAAPDANLLNAKVLTSRGSGTTSNIIAGINWALDPDGDENTDDGADIISMSFGGALTDLDGPLASTIRDAIDEGVIFVAASGNCKQGCGGFFGVTMPGSMPEVITVGAVDENNNAASFSSGDTFTNYIKPDITAPGVNIMSATKNGGYKSSSGTSMSTPMVAGLIALMLEKESLSHNQIKAKLENTAIDLGSSGKDIAYGSGSVNVSGLFGITITTNATVNETNATVNQTNSTVNQTNSSENETDEDNDIDKYEGFYITTPINVSTYATKEMSIQETSNDSLSALSTAPKEVRIKLRNDSVNVIVKDSAPEDIDFESAEYTTTSSGNGYIDYDDDYTYSTGDSDDGVVWGGEDLDVGLDGEESSTMVICYDWCGDGNLDHCFADDLDDFKSCWSQSSVLHGICSKKDKCWTGSSWDNDKVIDTEDPGDKWTCSIAARYYRDCSDSGYKWTDTDYEDYRVIYPRQYKCTDRKSGGTYYDGGMYDEDSNYEYWHTFKSSISCGSGKGCDESKDDSNADFGSDGDDKPSTPCSLKDGYGDCDNNNQCMPNSHCSCIGGCSWGLSTDYCCPSGKEWINSACRTCDSCSSTGAKKRTGDTVYECKDYGNFQCWNSISSLGNSDFCSQLTKFSQTCGYGEYDCDANKGQCGTNLYCVGSSLTGDKGCCRSTEDWDTSSHKCKKKDWQSCSAGSECYGGYCVHNICRSSSTYCGDNHCDNGENYDSCKADCNPSKGHKDYCDWKGTCSHQEYDCDGNGECGTNLECKRPPGTAYGDTDPNIDYDGCCYSYEEWDITSHTCKKKDSQSCSAGSECYGGYCVHNICRSTNTYCGDDKCDTNLGEDYDKCSADCDPQLGHADYCQWKGKCAYGEYDCDSNKDECASGLVCIGSGWTGDKGCCRSTEEWDTSSHKCKAKNGQSCTQDGNCYSGYCVHDICRPNKPYYGDGFCDSGETCATSTDDCGKCDQASCALGSECQGGYCVHNKCWHNPYIKGDGFCDISVGESQANSPGDCFGQLTVLDVTYWPPSVNQKQSFTVKAMLQNKGTLAQTLDLEAGIPPNSWYSYVISTNTSQNFTSQLYWGITQCCPGNKYYDAKRITLQPGEMQEVTFNLVAPTIHDVDACDTHTPKKSAWDNQHTLVVGLYSSCGQAYTQYKAKQIHVNDRYCYSDNACWQNERCNFNNGVPGVCALAVCENECDTDGAYFCVSSEIRQCEDVDNDGCLESKNIDYCVGEYDCLDGQSACVKKETKKIRVDYSNGYTTVNKQPGDILRLMIDQSGTPSLEYSTSAFDLDSCYSGAISTKECKFTVKDKPGTHKIGLRNGPEVTVKIIKNPKLIIITDRKELITRFGDEDEVDSMLAQAYRTAAEKDGCIYNLPDYITRDD